MSSLESLTFLSALDVSAVGCLLGLVTGWRVPSAVMLRGGLFGSPNKEGCRAAERSGASNYTPG